MMANSSLFGLNRRRPKAYAAMERVSGFPATGNITTRNESGKKRPDEITQSAAVNADHPNQRVEHDHTLLLAMNPFFELRNTRAVTVAMMNSSVHAIAEACPVWKLANLSGTDKTCGPIIHAAGNAYPIPFHFAVRHTVRQRLHTALTSSIIIDRCLV